MRGDFFIPQVPQRGQLFKNFRFPSALGTKFFPLLLLLVPVLSYVISLSAFAAHNTHKYDSSYRTIA